jgi:hypothetical protein
MNAPAKIEKPDAAIAHKGLYAALAAAQAEMGRALKDTSNPHFKSKYADLASVMDACMPALTRHGIAVLQPAYDDDTGRYVKTILVHGDTGEIAECRVPLIVQKNDMQGYGSAVTYARRYGLMGMAGIAPDDDDGNAAAKAAPQQEARPSGPPKEAIDTAIDCLGNAETLASLKAIWTDLPKDVQSVPAVIRAKDARKAALDAEASTAKPSIPEELDDGISY